MKKSIDQSLAKEIQDIAERFVPTIKYKHKLRGEVTRSDWRDFVSEEAFNEIGSDIAIGEHTNMFDFSMLGVTSKFQHIMSKLYPNRIVKPSGFYYYPKTGFMSWHTNSDVPCTRVYITFAEEGNKSFFRYYDKDSNQIVTSWDDEGVTIREFQVPDLPNKFWHCVGSDCDRFSFGFRIL